MANTKKLLKQLQNYNPVLLTVILTAVSVYYTAVSSQLQAKQLEIIQKQQVITERQARIDSELAQLEVQSMMPVFTLGVNLVGLKNGQRKEELRISAERHMAFNTIYRTWTQLSVERRKSHSTPAAISKFASLYKSEVTHSAKIPVNGYLGRVTQLHNQHTGLLVSAEVMNPHISTEIQQSLEKFEKDPLVSYSVQLKRYVKLQFVTANGKQHEKYFVLDTSGWGIPVSKSEFSEFRDQIETAASANWINVSGDIQDIEILRAWHSAQRGAKL